MSKQESVSQKTDEGSKDVAIKKASRRVTALNAQMANGAQFKIGMIGVGSMGSMMSLLFAEHGAEVHFYDPSEYGSCRWPPFSDCDNR